MDSVLVQLIDFWLVSAVPSGRVINAGARKL